MASFTPGPWTADIPRRFVYAYKRFVANVEPYRLAGVTEAEAQANCRLIAKAPELYAEHTEQLDRMAMWRDALIAALAKPNVRESILADVIEGLGISHDKTSTLLAEIDQP